MYRNRYNVTAALALSIVLVASALLVGLTPSSYATEMLGTKQVTKAADESTTIGSVELVMRKTTSTADGDVIVTIMKDGNKVDSATIDVHKIGRSSYTENEAEFDPALNVIGSFDIIVEHNGVGTILLSVPGSFGIDDGETATAGDESDEDENTDTQDEGENGGTDDNSDNNSTPESDARLSEILANEVASKSISGSIDIDSVEFSARKLVSGTDGQLVVAIVQNDELLGALEFDAGSIAKSTYSHLVAAFDEPLEAEGGSEVVIAHIGPGAVVAGNIVVVGETSTAGDGGGSDDGGSGGSSGDLEGTIKLTVNAVDQNNQAITGLWVTITNGITSQGEWTPETFTLEGGDTYTITMDDFYNSNSSTMFTFVKWADSIQDNSRTATLNEDETFTAVYDVAGNAPPPEDDPEPAGSPPADSPSGTLGAYAYRIPSSYWGPTFVGANAQMYFVLYNSTGYMIYGGFFDENGNIVTGLNDGETYWILPTDCHHCHGGTHDVAFNHWENGSTDRVRSVTTGVSVGAYYEYIPDTP